MPSIVPGFEYDIFISYRHNDNRSGWVTEFIKCLQEELASTIKEPVSVYFDSNPQDGLLETHNVDKSLEGKLKCLIFIPVISQTYCDPKSFAWQHEFCAFNKLAKVDQFGRDIKLNSGNVASRILPIKIHDLDAEDRTTLENEMGGVLRAVEFIYKSSGVNRPLTSSDKREDTASKTFYRDQINKVANAVKEIITSLKNPVTHTPINKAPLTTSPKIRKPLILIASVIFVLAVTGYFFYPKLIPGAKNETVLDKSIAVLPFENMSGDAEQEYLANGMSDEIIDRLAGIPKLKVIARTSSFAFKNSVESSGSIGKKLDVAYLLEGSIRKSGDKIRINAKLIIANTGQSLWSETFDRSMTDIFQIQDEMASSIASKLRLTLMPDDKSKEKNLEAYTLLLVGNDLRKKRPNGWQTAALSLYLRSIAIDSTDASVWAALSFAYSGIAFNESYRDETVIKARSAAEKATELDPKNAEGHAALSTVLSSFYWDWDNALIATRKANALTPGIDAGRPYFILGQLEEAERLAHETILRDPINPSHWREYAITQWYYGKHVEALASAQRVLLINPEFQNAHMQIGLILLTKGDLALAAKEFELEPNTFAKAYGLSMVYYALGQTEDSNRELNTAVRLSSKSTRGFYNLSRIYAFRGEKDNAFLNLYEAIKLEQPFMVFFHNDPLLKNLESDPRHIALLKKLNLPN